MSMLRNELTREEARLLVTTTGWCQNSGCNKPLTKPGSGSDDGQVDYEHATGIVRGVLCGNCNHGVGFAHDNAAVLRGLAEYISRPCNRVPVTHEEHRASRHVLTDIDLSGKTANCSVCGFTAIFVPAARGESKRVCLVRRQEILDTKRSRRRDSKANTRTYVNHMIFEFDASTSTGCCRLCGPVQVKLIGKNANRTCMNVWNAVRDQSNHKLTRLEATTLIVSANRCNNPGCQKVLDGPGSRADSGQVDHDHATGAIRGVLCGACNKALGHAKDNVETLIGLACFLENPPLPHLND